MSSRSSDPLREYDFKKFIYAVVSSTGMSFSQACREAGLTPNQTHMTSGGLRYVSFSLAERLVRIAGLQMRIGFEPINSPDSSRLWLQCPGKQGGCEDPRPHVTHVVSSWDANIGDLVPQVTLEEFEALKVRLELREEELLKLKGPCSVKDCVLHMAHMGKCRPAEGEEWP